MNARQVNATIFFVLYLAFLAWYNGWGMSPLTEAEVESYIANLAPDAEDVEFVNRLRALAANDTGDEIFMLNLNRYEYADGETRDRPPATYQAYGAGVVPMIIANAGHPVYSGRLPSFTVEGQSDWDEVILVRYRSRRDFLSMVTSDAYQDIASRHRAGGIAYAEVTPTTATFNLASPRLLVALLLLAPLILVDLLLRRRQS
jgi:uncharacterized protein (DUF1330 family)